METHAVGLVSGIMTLRSHISWNLFSFSFSSIYFSVHFFLLVLTEHYDKHVVWVLHLGLY